jgi:glutathione peroxidase
MKKLKRFAIILLLLLLAFFVYVEVVNRNSKGMNYRQKMLKAVYPAWMWWAKLTGKNMKELSNEKSPITSFYDLKAIANNGSEFSFNSLKGKKVLLVNTASECGYTNQYEDLQKLWSENKDKLVVIGFPANDFKEQEKGNDEQIAEFCKVNFGVDFPLMKKSTVIKTEGQNEVYQWLTDPKKNGWNEQPPSWNFSKYLVDEEGRLTNFFDATISPMSSEVLNAVNK